MGLGDDAEDFAQECVIIASEKNTYVKLDWCFANYRDKLRADKRLLSSPQGQLSGFRTISFDAPLDSTNEDSAKLGDVIGDTRVGVAELPTPGSESDNNIKDGEEKLLEVLMGFGIKEGTAKWAVRNYKKAKPLRGKWKRLMSEDDEEAP